MVLREFGQWTKPMSWELNFADRYVKFSRAVLDESCICFLFWHRHRMDIERFKSVDWIACTNTWYKYPNSNEIATYKIVLHIKCLKFEIKCVQPRLLTIFFNDSFGIMDSIDSHKHEIFFWFSYQKSNSKSRKIFKFERVFFQVKLTEF